MLSGLDLGSEESNGKKTNCEQPINRINKKYHGKRAITLAKGWIEPEFVLLTIKCTIALNLLSSTSATLIDPRRFIRGRFRTIESSSHTIGFATI
jgi:hypothetical protein